MTAGFQCKQFFIAHQHCAMKVGTDAMLLGAWAQLPTQGAVLDIGCGSGILSLMLAQRSHGQLRIDALDLDDGAVLQTQLNAQASPWPSAIRVLKQDILTYQPTERYSLLISNPPYFHQALPAANPARHRARHSEQMPWPDLLQHAAQLIDVEGYFDLVIPFEAASSLISLAAEHGWQPVRMTQVQSKAGRPPIRCLLSLQRLSSQTALNGAVTSLCINDANGDYTADYRRLLHDFYLKF